MLSFSPIRITTKDIKKNLYSSDEASCIRLILKLREPEMGIRIRNNGHRRDLQSYTFTNAKG